MKAIWNKVKENTLLSILSVLLTLTFVAFVCVLFSECAGTYISELPGLSKKNLETLKFVGIGMGGLLVALQALMSYKRAKALEDTAKTQAEAAKSQARATEEQAKANKNTEQGQRQERLKNAIEHLGHESDSVRIGGAYELFHLVEDAENRELRRMVFDILCAHICRTTGERKYRETYESKPSAEIQSLLTLLFVQKHEVFKGLHINLEGSWLNGANLKDARLAKAALTQTHLQGVFLHKAQLQGAVLHKAQLQRAILTWAELQRAMFNSAQLQGAELSWAQLQGAKFDKAQLQGTKFFGTQLQGATLSGAQLQGAELVQTHLQAAVLFEAQLQGATLTGTKLQGIVSEKWLSSISFEDRIRGQAGKETNLYFSKVIFSGGLSQEDVDSLVKDLSDEKANKLREKLTPHIGQPKSNQLPEGSDAITGSYNEQEAEKWIAEYNQSMSEVRGDNS